MFTNDKFNDKTKWKVLELALKRGRKHRILDFTMNPQSLPGPVAVLLIAPIISFTADEIWENIHLPIFDVDFTETIHLLLNLFKEYLRLFLLGNY